VVNVSDRYLWRDYYAQKIRELCHKMCLAMLAIGPIHCFRGVLRPQRLTGNISTSVRLRAVVQIVHHPSNTRFDNNSGALQFAVNIFKNI
jgi:hypothetical protein